MKEEMAQRKIKKTFDSRKRKAVSRASPIAEVSQDIPLADICIPCITEEQKHKAFSGFDKANTQLVYSHCQICHQIRLDWKVVPVTFDRKRLMCCNKCKSLNNAEMQSPQQWLPTWKDSNNEIHYEVPPQLAVLREVEKLLI